MEFSPKEHAKFFSKVDKTETCWLWTGSLQANGYGRIYFRGRDAMAHRVSYIAANGEPEPGLVIDHMCHVRECVNPQHLRAVTHKQNSEHQAGPSKNCRTGVLGVYKDRATGKFIAKVRHGSQRIHVGRFATLDEAKAAVIAKRNELFTHNDRDRQAA